MKLIRRLLPRGKAWQLAEGSTIARFVQALEVLGADAKAFADRVWSGLLPSSTDQLDEWDREIGLYPADGLSEQQQRERLAGRWAAQGGQTVAYIEATLAAAGFGSLRVYEWPADQLDPPTPRDPSVLVGVPSAAFGDTSAEFGDPGLQFGPGAAGSGYWLVNNTFNPTRYPLRLTASPGAPSQFGTVGAQFGDPAVQFGGPGGDPIDLRAYYLYICGASFGDVVQVPAERRRDLESLLLRICPAQQWLVLTVEYV